MPFETSTTLAAAIKTRYGPNFRDALNSSVRAFRLFGRSRRDWDGRQINFPIRTNRDEVGIGARAEGGELPPVTGSETLAEATVGYRMHYARGAISRPAIKQMKSNLGSYVRTTDFKMQTMYQNIKKDMNRATWGWGTGVLALLDGAHNAQTNINVQVSPSSPQAAAATTTSHNSPASNGTRYIKPGMTVVIGSAADIAAGGAAVDYRTVSSVTDQNTFVISDATSGNPADGDLIVRGHSTDVGDNNYNNELLGLEGIVDDTTPTTYLGLTRATYSGLQAAVYHNNDTGRTINTRLILQAMNAVRERSDGVIDWICGHPTTTEAYVNDLTPDVRYAPRKLIAGFNVLSVAGGESGEAFVYDDVDCPYNKLFLLDRSVIFMYVLDDFSFVDEDGSVLHRGADTDTFELRLAWYGDMASELPNTAAKIEDISVSGILDVL